MSQNYVHFDHGRIIDLREKSLTPSKMEEIWKDLENNKCVRHVIWGDIPTNPSSVELQKKIEEKIFQNNKNYLKYPNDFIHALLSSHVYEDSKPGEKVEFKLYDKVKYNQYLTNWKVHKVYNKAEAGKYYAACFTNESENQLVLAHRGTKFTIEDIGKFDSPVRTDIVGIVGKEIVAQLIQDYVVTKEVVAYAKEKGYQLSITGHSLGAWLAEFCLYYCTTAFHYQAKAVTFDSPGSIGINDYSSSIKSRGTEANNSDLDIVTYLSSPNFVNTCNGHLGSAYRVFPKVNTKSKQILEKIFKAINIDIEPISSIFSHSLDPIIETFNPLTGKPNEYQQIINWPVIKYTPKESTGLTLFKQWFNNTIADPFSRDESDGKYNLNKILFCGTLVSFLDLVVDILTGRFNPREYLECWNNLKQISDGKLPVSHSTNPEIEFRLKYNGRYEVDKVKLHKDRIDKPSLRYLKALGNKNKKTHLCDNQLIEKQINVIRKQYLIVSDKNSTNSNKIIKVNGNEVLTVEQLNNWLLILVALDPEFRFILDNDNRGQTFSEAVTNSYHKLSTYANKILPDLVSKSSVAQRNDGTFEKVKKAIEEFKKLGAEDAIKQDFIAKKITSDQAIDFIRTLHSLSNHYMYYIHDGKKARVLLQLCKDIAEACVPFKVGSKLNFKNLEPKEIYEILSKCESQPEKLSIVYARLIYSFGRTYIYKKRGTREDGVKYFKLAEYLGNKYNLFEEHLSVRSGLGVIEEDAIDAYIKTVDYNVEEAKIKILKMIELYKKLESNDKLLNENPLAPLDQQKIFAPKNDPYNIIECNEQILKYYGKLISITHNSDEKIRYTQEITKCTKILFDKLKEVQDKKSASVFNTLADALLVLNDANIESNELLKLMQLAKEKLENEKKEIAGIKKKILHNNLDIIYSLYDDAFTKSSNNDFTKADSANGMMKVLSKQIANSPKDEQLKLEELKKRKTDRDSINEGIKREIDYDD